MPLAASLARASLCAARAGQDLANGSAAALYRARSLAIARAHPEGAALMHSLEPILAEIAEIESLAAMAARAAAKVIFRKRKMTKSDDL